MVMDREKRESKCYGFVVFEDAESAALALDANITISGRDISVAIADSTEVWELGKDNVQIHIPVREIVNPERSHSRHDSRSRSYLPLSQSS